MTPIDPATAFSIPLKLKNRNPGRLLHRQFDPPEGTWTFVGGTYKSKTANSGTANKVKTLRPRKRSYGPF